MEKLIGIVAVLLILFVLMESPKAEKPMIPEEALRFRVIANSDLDSDIELKNKIKDDVQKELSKWLSGVENVEVARQILSTHVGDLDVIVRDSLLKYNSNETFNVDFGFNYFPQKEYRGVIYEEGYYESVVITLGEGKGSNWWCVMYPPLCILETDETASDVEYRLFVSDLLKKFENNN